MAIGPKLEFRQSQQLVMTPQLMQAIKLLQMSNVDLIAHINSELESNPFLEQDDNHETEATQANSSGDEETLDASLEERAQSEENWLQSDLEATTETISNALDSELTNVFPDDNGEQTCCGPSPAKRRGLASP